MLGCAVGVVTGEVVAVGVGVAVTVIVLVGVGVATTVGVALADGVADGLVLGFALGLLLVFGATWLSVVPSLPSRLLPVVSSAPVTRANVIAKVAAAPAITAPAVPHR